MAKFVLHGGETKVDSKSNRDFFAEMVLGLKENDKILLVYFARDENVWPKLFAEDKPKFLRLAKVNMELIMADKDINKFREQLEFADVVYMRGGHNEYLYKALEQINNLGEILDKKVAVAGSSAGANVLSEYYYSTTNGTVKKGLGILPIKVFPHYFDAQSKQLKILKNHGEDLDIYPIEEEKFVIIS